MKDLFKVNYLMLGFFKDVQIEPEFSSDPEERYVDLNFVVEERRTGQAMMGAGYSDRDKLLGQIGLQIPNLRGTGQNLDFRWEFGTRREQFVLGFTEPWLFDTPTSLSARVSILSLEYFNYYDSQRNSVSVRIGRRLKSRRPSSARSLPQSLCIPGVGLGRLEKDEPQLTAAPGDRQLGRTLPG